MKNWEKKKLGEVCIVERGSSPRPIEKYQTDSPDGVNWIKIGDTKGVDKYIFSTKEKITKEGAEKSRYVKEGDFILSNSMSFGKPYIMKTDGYIHDGWFVFRLPDYLDKDYFYYLLTSPNVQEQIQSLGAGAIVKNISGDLVKKVDVTYPKSLPEQQRIVSILDEAFAAIAKAKANAEQNLKNAKELFESYLQGVFENKGEGWEIKTLGEVSKINYGYTEKASFDEVGPKFLRITDIQENGVDWDTVPYCKCSDKDLPKYKLEKGDIVFARTGATTGKSYLIDNPPISVFASYLIRLRMNSINEFIPEFISYFFQTKTYWDKINAGISGSAQGGFNATKLGELEFHFPKSKTEQQAIVRQLDALRVETQKLEAVYQKKIANLEELKKSILQKAFAGELKTSQEVV